MIFSELYSAYYRTVAAILSAILDGEKNEKALQDIVIRHAFGESVLTILPALKTEKWQLVHTDMTTPIRHKPTLPLTTLQKRWLKAISLDPRVQLFGVDFPALEDVTPLFTPEDHYVYDSGELCPWIRTFICRITQMNFSNRTVENRFKRDLEEMYMLYGIGKEADE